MPTTANKKMVSFSFGTTPESVIRERLPERYNMSLTDPVEHELLQRLVNKGIDSHLEAVTGNFRWGKRTVPSGAVTAVELNGDIDREGMVCLLRRLLEDDSEAAWLLRCDVLSTLDIEEV